MFLNPEGVTEKIQLKSWDYVFDNIDTFLSDYNHKLTTESLFGRYSDRKTLKRNKKLLELVAEIKEDKQTALLNAKHQIDFIRYCCYKILTTHEETQENGTDI